MGTQKRLLVADGEQGLADLVAACLRNENDAASKFHSAQCGEGRTALTILLPRPKQTEAQKESC